jgi:hypothetical protein
VNHHGLGKPLAQEHMGRQEFAGGPYQISRLTVMAKAPVTGGGAGMGRRPWPRRTMPNGEVGNAEDW